jgi:ABC-type polysaccharide/polyol phosphate transport system ATPase subunit
MPSPKIEVREVWKKFHRGELHDSLRDLVPDLARRLVGRAPRRDELAQDDFWALKDISFDVTPGQALGIIGPNGAGKSTMLKLLTKIMRPTRGSCSITGRVGALIEVAAGFHPDLTGRENVFLQGAIMGMPKIDIVRKFDEILAFSGIAEFIDTPVKRYSSGMSARLGFAIAAHLDPEVLIVDEVLAVGDFSFQQRAFGRIESMVKSGIPVVVVSHQLDRVATLCTHGILLGRGAIVHSGSPTECVAAYLRTAGGADVVQDGRNPFRLERLDLQSTQPLRSGGPARFRIEGHVSSRDAESEDTVGLRVRAVQTGKVLYATSTQDWHIAMPSDGDFELDVDLQLNVPAGIYSFESHVYSPRLNKDVLVGPTLVLPIEPGAPFWGSVQMNSRMGLASRKPDAPFEPAR